MAETPLQIVRGKSVDEILRRAGIIPALPGSTNKALLEGSASALVVELKFSSLPDNIRMGRDCPVEQMLDTLCKNGFGPAVALSRRAVEPRFSPCP